MHSSIINMPDETKTYNFRTVKMHKDTAVRHLLHFLYTIIIHILFGGMKWRILL